MEVEIWRIESRASNKIEQNWKKEEIFRLIHLVMSCKTIVTDSLSGAFFVSSFILFYFFPRHFHFDESLSELIQKWAYAAARKKRVHQIACNKMERKCEIDVSNEKRASDSSIISGGRSMLCNSRWCANVVDARIRLNGGHNGTEITNMTIRVSYRHGAYRCSTLIGKEQISKPVTNDDLMFLGGQISSHAQAMIIEQWKKKQKYAKIPF